ncbi:redoxin domain-containing protein [Conexibacter sp. DBS9H8]|uniref:redoxin domain-containing protein n=1 Tax=Conexibacter sp. DBS9H8 TaxID=2937801 RepID=UPI00200CD9E8|nr:redoxin domain-containing protein [Conexibacter sp. DBS9H8]
MILLGVFGLRTHHAASAGSLASNPNLDPGTSLAKPATDFTLRDQFGRRVSLGSYRGRVVLLAFIDSTCTTVCPLTTSAMRAAQQQLGRASSRVQLLAVNANPAATSVSAVRAYSSAHGMLVDWRFLTGSQAQLRRVWHAYGIAAEITRGQIDHTPALFAIDPRGVERKVYLTQMNFTTVDQLGHVLAREAASLLPGHPRLRSSKSYAPLPLITPGMPVTLRRAGGGSVRLGQQAPRLSLFFATWVDPAAQLARHLEELGRYQALAVRHHLPLLTAIDERTVEASPAALTSFLRALPHPLSYPVAVDPTGQIADGYEVQDEPWLELTSATGQILWYDDPVNAGWPSASALGADVRAALAHAPKTPAGSQALAGSPAPLAALHAQAGQLLGTSGLLARIRGLRGYPIVLNAWASWCTPCRKEFGLFASASRRYGQRVAFLGANTEDSPGDARAFLRQHPVSYPSYQATTAELAPLAAIEGLPTTIFIGPSGKVLYVHTGQYETQGTLDQDIATNALK